ncbi:uncharacterized protein PGTG_22407 [Puccinia graminis f. sp. tritici CRL 75-36-700-3]|uniref:Uncharacterized protein n=1 Tax=Puccinia graminis f. sp. tritici (strain CRL 75-36-700-3 / race SCCL) TaxID=418459 RepID=H6QUI6_PUCGT|nr:uncharacterized protein PGTG_22407 [Puccinia graminis f. sp. tritici CRL 75-36-700-3]EHS64698.1 hypothetical protein PGTG_22407 [Puccinia graminis f. sp. tritici CRL 75-36-700-3]
MELEIPYARRPHCCRGCYGERRVGGTFCGERYRALMSQRRLPLQKSRDVTVVHLP